MLLYLLTDTCSLKMIPSPAASIAACSGGVLDSIIKLKKRDRERGWWGEREVGKNLDWVEENNRELRKLSGQGRVSLPSDSRSEGSSSWNLCSWAWQQSRAQQSTGMMSSAVRDRSEQKHLCTVANIYATAHQCISGGGIETTKLTWFADSGLTQKYMYGPHKIIQYNVKY